MACCESIEHDENNKDRGTDVQDGCHKRGNGLDAAVHCGHEPRRPSALGATGNEELGRRCEWNRGQEGLNRVPEASIKLVKHVKGGRMSSKDPRDKQMAKEQCLGRNKRDKGRRESHMALMSDLVMGRYAGHVVSVVSERNSCQVHLNHDDKDEG